VDAPLTRRLVTEADLPARLRVAEAAIEPPQAARGDIVGRRAGDHRGREASRATSGSGGRRRR
jgi:hypothetical protein